MKWFTSKKSNIFVAVFTISASRICCKYNSDNSYKPTFLFSITHGSNPSSSWQKVWSLTKRIIFTLSELLVKHGGEKEAGESEVKKSQRYNFLVIQRSNAQMIIRCGRICHRYYPSVIFDAWRPKNDFGLWRKSVAFTISGLWYNGGVHKIFLRSSLGSLIQTIPSVVQGPQQWKPYLKAL